jgi:class 3 adenylate cyclase/predicted ATPase
MLTCPSCGHENNDAAAFCEACGAAIGVGSAERRKVVSVLFCDVVGSTALGGSTDPEALRALLARYFDQMRGVVERHGGSVEKFIGDAVMAVFGVPVAHEDDALRACRAAVEMREAFAGLGIEGRIGVSTGEVVTGTEERLATGEALNVAARLQQAAAPGEVLIAEATRVLVGGAVDVEPIEPLALKGKSDPVPAYRLLEARAASERRHDTVFVGRELELALLGEAWGGALVEGRCELVTIIGDAGLGKSRLTAEALASIEARVVRGRCLPYGAGITYWSVVEVVKQLDALPTDPAAAAAIRSLLGESEAATSAEEIAWAFRKLLEEQAPLVVVFDDIQWGEETFLDLVEHVALLSRDAPLLLLCMARPELLDHRPSWPLTVRLEPLSTEDTSRLIGTGVAEELRTKIAHAAGGNPLFIGEMLAMAGEAGDEIQVPPTLKALLAARLDQLDVAERQVLERAAIEGEVFHRGAVQALAPDESQVTPRLAALVRRQLIRPDKAQFAGEDAFRFRHLLIRDAAYDALPKSMRAELHERFAGWLELREGDLVELDEILGYHLEQAYRFRIDLGSADEALTSLGARASQRLELVGRKALTRSDLHAAIDLLERAASLSAGDGARRAKLLSEIGGAMIEAGRLSEAERVLGEATTVAAEAGDHCAESRALVQQQFLKLLHITEGGAAEAARVVQRVVPIFERGNDDHGLCNAHRLEAFLHWNDAHAAAAAEAWERAAGHASRAGDERTRAEILTWIASAHCFGPTPVVEGIRRCEEIRSEVSGQLESEALTLRHLASLHAMSGRFELARSLLATSNAVFEDLGLTLNAATSPNEAVIEMLAENPAAAETSLRSGFDALTEIGEQSFLSTTAALLARTVFAQERLDEAEELAQLSAQLTASGDVVTHALWRGVQARILARRGRLEEAEVLSREAVLIVDQTDFLLYRGDALVDLAHILHDGGRAEEAALATAAGLHFHEQKGNLVTSRKIRSDLGVLL